MNLHCLLPTNLHFIIGTANYYCLDIVPGHHFICSWDDLGRIDTTTRIFPLHKLCKFRSFGYKLKLYYFLPFPKATI